MSDYLASKHVRHGVRPMKLQLPVQADKRNGVCGYCRHGLTAQRLPDGRKHYVCPVACKPWMTRPGEPS